MYLIKQKAPESKTPAPFCQGNLSFPSTNDFINGVSDRSQLAYHGSYVLATQKEDARRTAYVHSSPIARQIHGALVGGSSGARNLHIKDPYSGNAHGNHMNFLKQPTVDTLDSWRYADEVPVPLMNKNQSRNLPLGLFGHSKDLPHMVNHPVLPSNGMISSPPTSNSLGDSSNQYQHQNSKSLNQNNAAVDDVPNYDFFKNQVGATQSDQELGADSSRLSKLQFLQEPNWQVQHAMQNKEALTGLHNCSIQYSSTRRNGHRTRTTTA